MLHSISVVKHYVAFWEGTTEKTVWLNFLFSSKKFNLPFFISLTFSFFFWVFHQRTQDGIAIIINIFEYLLWIYSFNDWAFWVDHTLFDKVRSVEKRLWRNVLMKKVKKWQNQVVAFCYSLFKLIHVGLLKKDLHMKICLVSILMSSSIATSTGYNMNLKHYMKLKFE